LALIRHRGFGRDCRIDKMIEGMETMGSARTGWALLVAGIALAIIASLSMAEPMSRGLGHPGVAAALGVAVFALGVLVGVRLSGVRAADERGRSLDRQLALARDELMMCRDDSEALQRSVSHDLRSPIGAVLNFATVLELDHGDDLGAEGRQVVQRIRRSAESGLVLLDALSRLSRVARASLRRAPVEVETLVRQAFAELGEPAARAELALGAIPPALADADLLRTAFRELLSNAVKFSRGLEKPQITVRGVRQDDGTLVYTVADEGVGFDMRFAGKLFRSFERLHSRDEFAGAGVGLAIVRKVAERHGGRVWAEAEVDGGARFHLALPGAA
jgi:light-regulated signal transduction histidine kinase (bacteriophytochrome)